MHIPDGFIDAPVSIGAGLLAISAVSVSLKKTRGQLDSKTAPMAGLAAVFIFAVQMMNFPVAAGTSGHLLGGVLAAILIGPYAAMLAMTVVLSIQALVFADGGLSALGLNILNMGIVTVVIGWGMFVLLQKLLPKNRSGLITACVAAAFVSVPASAAAFVVEYALGGTATFTLSAVLKAVIGVHLLIGIGEALITAVTVSAVLSARPDLVYGARKLQAASQLVITNNEKISA